MDAQTLLKDASQMPLAEIERFVQSLNALITQMKSTDKNYQDRLLLRKINQTVLGITKTKRYQHLVQKMEMETMSDLVYCLILDRFNVTTKNPASSFADCST